MRENVTDRYERLRVAVVEAAKRHEREVERLNAILEARTAGSLEDEVDMRRQVSRLLSRAAELRAIVEEVEDA